MSKVIHEDIISSLLDWISTTDIKSTIVLVFVFIIISSTVFIDRILSEFPGATYIGQTASTYGTLLQAIALVIGFSFGRLLISAELL